MLLLFNAIGLLQNEHLRSQPLLLNKKNHPSLLEKEVDDVFHRFFYKWKMKITR